MINPPAVFAILTRLVNMPLAVKFLLSIALTLLQPATTNAKTGYKNVVYFKETGTYTDSGDFHLFDLDWSRITHVKYGFANPLTNGTVALSDEFAAIFRNYVDASNDTANLRGSFGLANALKRQARTTKFGLSIGGELLSANFSTLARTDAGRKTFASSAVRWILDLGLDLIEIHWVWPVVNGDPLDMNNYLLLLKAVRTELDKLTFPVELTAVAPGVQDLYRHWNTFQICRLVDQLHVSSFDFNKQRVFDHHDQGQRRLVNATAYTDHHANLYVDPGNPGLANDEVVPSVHGTIQFYLNGGCPSDKIVMGIPSFGQSFDNTAGLYKPYTPSTNGSWVNHGQGQGIWDYKALPLHGSTEVYNATIGATYSYDASRKVWMSYDGPQSVAAKLEYIKANKLGGAMFSSGDSDALGGTTRSLITQSFNAFGRANMAFQPNTITYPESKYTNIRTRSMMPATRAVGLSCGGNHNVCYWPATEQVVLNWRQENCTKHANVLVWCP